MRISSASVRSGLESILRPLIILDRGSRNSTADPGSGMFGFAGHMRVAATMPWGLLSHRMTPEVPLTIPLSILGSPEAFSSFSDASPLPHTTARSLSLIRGMPSMQMTWRHPRSLSLDSTAMPIS